jgi:hypothetical protein
MYLVFPCWREEIRRNCRAERPGHVRRGWANWRWRCPTWFVDGCIHDFNLADTCWPNGDHDADSTGDDAD